jgi:hypothetical protein
MGLYMLESIVVDQVRSLLSSLCFAFQCIFKILKFIIIIIRVPFTPMHLLCLVYVLIFS